MLKQLCQICRKTITEEEPRYVMQRIFPEESEEAYAHKKCYEEAGKK